MSDEQYSSDPHTCAQRLRSVLTNTIPYCSGTLPLKPRDFILYYGEGTNLGRIDLSSASASELDHLQSTCLPATFGLNDQDVLDDTYRKAGKLDSNNFMVGFDAEREGIVEAIYTSLFPGREEVAITAELYKLNVYGKDSFFKQHKDTPRAPNMFGSLVIVFPAAHTGGDLILGSKECAYTFDSSALLSPPEMSSSIAFVAFFSDVDHEVKPVTSGHRVTITYNIYFCSQSAPPDHCRECSRPRTLVQGLRLLQPKALNLDELTNALGALLSSDMYGLDRGGTLGFGLRHQYPLPRTWSKGDPDPLKQLEQWLKGSDAALFRACKMHGLSPLLRLIYYDKDHWGDSEFKHRHGLLFNQMPWLEWSNWEEPLEEQLRASYSHGAKRGGIEVYFGALGDMSEEQDWQWYKGLWGDGTQYRRIDMVTDTTRWNKVKSPHIAYGNEHTLGLMYAYVCLIVDIGPADARANVKWDAARWDTADTDIDRMDDGNSESE